MSTADLCLQPATTIARLIREREVSAVEVLEAHLARIEAINSLVNAIVTLDIEGAHARARAIDAALKQGDDPGPLAGLPVRWPDCRLRTRIWPRQKECARRMARLSLPISCPILML